MQSRYPKLEILDVSGNRLVDGAALEALTKASRHACIRPHTRTSTRGPHKGTVSTLVTRPAGKVARTIPACQHLSQALQRAAQAAFPALAELYLRDNPATRDVGLVRQLRGSLRSATLIDEVSLAELPLDRALDSCAAVPASTGAKALSSSLRPGSSYGRAAQGSARPGTPGMRPGTATGFSRPGTAQRPGTSGGGDAIPLVRPPGSRQGTTVPFVNVEEIEARRVALRAKMDNARRHVHGAIAGA
eukprot:2563169-Pleurochrysis_carterae.AAC.1